MGHISGLDTPQVGQIAAYVTAVFGPAGGAVEDTTSRTDIADRRGGPPQVSAETNAAAVTVEATLSTGEARRLELGTVAGNGAVTVIHQGRRRGVGGACRPIPAGSTARPSWPPARRHQLALPRLCASAGGWPSGTPGRPGSMRRHGVRPRVRCAAPWPARAGGTFAVDQIRPELGLHSGDPIVALDAGPPRRCPRLGSAPRPRTPGNGGGRRLDEHGLVTKDRGCLRAECGFDGRAVPDAGTAPHGLIQIVASDVVARCEINGALAAATSGQVARQMVDPARRGSVADLTLSGMTVTAGPSPTGRHG